MVVQTDPKRVAFPPRSAGFTLIEILVTVLIIAISFLGAAALQSVGLKEAQSLYFRSQASLIGTDLTEKMRANVIGLKAGDYQLAIGATPSGSAIVCDAAECDPETMADADIAASYQLAADRLPAGQLAVTAVAGGVIQIRVMWDERRNDAAGLGCDPSNEADLACLILNAEVEEIAAR